MYNLSFTTGIPVQYVGLDSAFLVAGLVVIKINYYWGISIARNDR